MPLKLTRKHGTQTTITFPGGAQAVVQTDGIDQEIVSIDDNLRATQTSAGELVISPAYDDWPVCIIEMAGHVEGSEQAAFSFDAPDSVVIHRDNIRRKL